MNSSAVVVGSAGSPRAARTDGLTARSKRPLLAITTRSVRSRSNGFAGCLNEPQAQLPPAPLALRQLHPTRSRRPRRALRMVIPEAERARYGKSGYGEEGG